MRVDRASVEHLIEDLTRGNVTEVKVVLASALLALAGYQLLLAAGAYERVRLPFLSSHAASWTHRASGDAIVVLVAAKVLAVRIGGTAHFGPTTSAELEAREERLEQRQEIVEERVEAREERREDGR